MNSPIIRPHVQDVENYHHFRVRSPNHVELLRHRSNLSRQGIAVGEIDQIDDHDSPHHRWFYFPCRILKEQYGGALQEMMVAWDGRYAVDSTLQGLLQVGDVLYWRYDCNDREIVTIRHIDGDKAVIDGSKTGLAAVDVEKLEAYCCWAVPFRPRHCDMCVHFIREIRREWATPHEIHCSVFGRVVSVLGTHNTCRCMKGNNGEKD